MRTDRHAKELPLSPDQRFFVGCWLNLVHDQSLDSHRVRTMNPRNALREFLGVLEATHANESDRSIVCDEAVGILADDRVLKNPPFLEVTSALLILLQRSKGKPNSETLAPHLARELLDKIEGRYIGSALELLRGALLDSEPAAPDERQALIEQVTGSLLSTLADGGASLETLFQLYRQILVPVREPPARYAFHRKLGLLTKILQQPPRNYFVLFAIDNVTNDFPAEMGGISFSNEAADWNVRAELASHIAPSPRRLFAELIVEARDVRAAGTEAYTRIGNLLDLTRFEYERERVSLSEEFLICDADQQIE